MSTRVTGGRDALTGTDVVRLFDQSRVERRVGNGTLPAWARRHYEAFGEKLLGERNDVAFPCHFGVDAQRNGGALYAFVPGTRDTGATDERGSADATAVTGERALDALADVLEAYLATFRMHGARTSLVTFFEPPSDPEAWGEREYRDAFWHVLQYLHDVDADPWPAAIPTDPAHPQFEFCYAGDPMFVTGAAPFMENRRSRYNEVGLEVTFQPRSVFDGITGDTDAGQRARGQIHDRIESYDGTSPHAHIGDWEDDGSHEWKQYLLPDGDARYADDACPLDVDPVAIAGENDSSLRDDAGADA